MDTSSSFATDQDARIAHLEARLAQLEAIQGAPRVSRCKRRATLLLPWAALPRSEQPRRVQISEARRVTTKSARDASVHMEPPKLSERITSFLDIEKPSGPEGSASIFSSAVNLANTVLGTGILALPRSLSFAGFVPGFALIVGSALVNTLTNVYISDAAISCGWPASFRKLSDKAGGSSFSVLVDCSCVVSTLGTGISYAIVAANGLSRGVPLSFGVHLAPLPPFSWVGLDEHLAWVAVVTAIITPLSLLRSLDALRLTSLIAVAILLAITLLVVLYALPEDMVGDNFDACPTDGSANEQSCPPGEASYFTAMSGVLDALPALAMAYACQISTPTLWNEMYQPTRGRMLLLYLYALGGAMALYLLVGGFGYSTFGSRVLSNLLSSYPASPIINAARIGLSFVTIFSFPIQAMALRQSIASIVDEARKTCCGGAEAGKATGPHPASIEAAVTLGRLDSLDKFEITPGVLPARMSSQGAIGLSKSGEAMNGEATGFFPGLPPPMPMPLPPNGVPVSPSLSGVAGPPMPKVVESVELVVAPLPPASDAVFELSPSLVLPTVAFIAVATLLSAMGVDIGLVIDVVGTLGASTISIIAPSFIYLRLFPDSPLVPAARATLLLGFVVMGWGTAKILS